MKKKFGKFLSILLTVAMMLSLLPATAFADDRTVVRKVDASLDRDITPGYGELAEDPAFAVTDGQPAYFAMGGWRKKAGDDWILVAYNDRFSEGIYRYEVQVRIDDEDAKNYVLSGNNDVTVKVNGERWETIQDVRAGGGDDGYSYMVVASDEFPVSAPENLELTFHDSSVFDIEKSFKGHEIQSYFVAQNVEGGTKPYAFSKVSGPAWISVSAEGEISGTPNAVGENADLVVQVTDSKGAEATITINVAETVLSSSDREKIYTFKAKSLTGDITPEYGSSGAEDPKFTVMEGQPAYLSDTMGYYIKKVGEDWVDINVNDTIDEGTYRYKVQLRIDADKGGEEYVLPQAVITVTVDGEEWEVVYPVATEGKASWVWVMSPELTVTKPVIVALDVKGIKAPVDGETADTSTITINNGNGITVSEAKWKKGDASLVDKFEANETYYLHINYAVDDDYTVDEDAKVLHDLTGGIIEEHRTPNIVIKYTVPETYTVTVETDGKGTASASPVKAAAGTTVTLTATPNEGYEFVEWEVPAHSNIRFIDDNSFIMPGNDVAVKATFKAKAAVTTINTINITGITAPVADKSPVTDGITTDTTGVTLKTIQWEKTGGVIMDSSEKFEVGQTYTLYISYEPQSGYEISNTVTVTSDLENSNVNATSTHVNIQYTVPEAATYTVTVTDGTARQVTPVNGEYATTIETKAGSRILLKADDKEGKVFTGWSGLDGIRLYGDGTTVADATLQFIMPEKNVTVTANYIDESADNVIKNIKITGITTPLAGANPKVDGITINTEKVRLIRAEWRDNGAYFGWDKTFEKGKQYCLYVNIELDEGYSVANDVNITADIKYDRATERDNYVYIYYTVKDEAPASYTVTFEANGGSGTIAPVTGVSGEYTLPECGFTAPEGKQFKAWKVDGAEYAVGTKITVSGDTTVTAVWKDVSTLITIDAINVTGIIEPVAGETADKSGITINNNNGITVKKTRWSKFGSSSEMAASETFVGGALYDLMIWYDLAEGYTVSPSAVFTHNLPDSVYEGHSSTSQIVQVRYRVPYNVTVTADGNGTASASPATAAEGATVELTATPDSGYEFEKWEVVSVPDGTTGLTIDENGKFTMPAGNVAVKAIFKVKAAAPVETYTVTVENGTGDGEYAAGETVTIKADSKSGYKFDKWIVETENVTLADKNDSTTTFVMPEGNVVVKADYDKVSSGSSSSGGSTKYTVKVEDTDNGSVESSRTKASKGTTVTITVDPEAGYEVDDIVVETKAGKEVEVTDKGEGKFTFKMPAANVTVSVDFAKAAESDDAQAVEEYILLTIDSVIAWVFDEYVANDVAPVIRNARTMLPARFVAEALGGVVTWDEAEQKVTIVNGEDTIVIFIGEPFATVNGAPVELDSPAFIENDRTYLPIRFIAENMGATVTWDADARTVTIVPGK